MLRIFGISAVIALAGCMTELDTRTSTSSGARYFAENCAACHGADARGFVGDWHNGNRPPDLTGLAERNGGVFPEVEALATIYGPAFEDAHGRMMPEFGDRDLGPTVIVELEEGIGTPVPADLVALSAYLRSIQR